MDGAWGDEEKSGPCEVPALCQGSTRQGSLSPKHTTHHGAARHSAKAGQAPGSGRSHSSVQAGGKGREAEGKGGKEWVRGRASMHISGLAQSWLFLSSAAGAPSQQLSCHHIFCTTPKATVAPRALTH